MRELNHWSHYMVNVAVFISLQGLACLSFKWAKLNNTLCF